MFIGPRLWVDGESSVRAESVNSSIANNLESFRSVLSRRLAISTRSERPLVWNHTTNPALTNEVEATYRFDGGQTREQTAWFGPTVSNTAIMAIQQPAVLWLPLRSLRAGMKTSENIYIRIRCRFLCSSSTYSVSSSRVACTYLGSDAEMSPSATPQLIEWNANASSTANPRGNSRIAAYYPLLPYYEATVVDPMEYYLTTDEVVLDTSVMSTSDVSIAAFRFDFVQFKTYRAPSNTPLILQLLDNGTYALLATSMAILLPEIFVEVIIK